MADNDSNVGLDKRREWAAVIVGENKRQANRQSSSFGV